MQELPVQFGTGTPTGPDWHTLSSINAAVIGEWLDAFRSGGAQGRTDVAGVWLAGYLASAIASPLAISLHHHGFGWPLSSGVLAVRRHAGGWFDRVAVAASPSSLSEADLARDLVGVLSPIFALIRSQTRLGWPVLWGTLGDAITAALVDHASSIGASPSSAWDAGLRFVDLLAVHAPRYAPAGSSSTSLGPAAVRRRPEEIAQRSPQGTPEFQPSSSEACAASTTGSRRWRSARTSAASARTVLCAPPTGAYAAGRRT